MLTTVFWVFYCLLALPGVVTAVEKLGSSGHIHLSENTVRLAVNAHGTGEVQVFCELPQVKMKIIV